MKKNYHLPALIFNKKKITRLAKRQKCIFLKSLCMLFCTMLPIVFLSAYLNPVFAQQRDPCDTEKEVTKKTILANAAKTKADKLAQDFKKLPPPKPKPAGNKDAAAAQAALDAAVIKWDLSRKDLDVVKKNPGRDVLTLQQDIANKQRELAEKQDELRNKDTKSYIDADSKSRIMKFEKEFEERINGFSRKTARAVLDNTEYKQFDPSNTQAIKDCEEKKRIQLNASQEMSFKSECYSDMAEKLLKFDPFKSEKITRLRRQLQYAVKTSNAAGIDPTTTNESPQEMISRAGPELIKEMENTRTDLDKKYTEYAKLDNGIGILSDEINALRAEIKTLENRLKPIIEAEKKANDDAQKEYDEAEKKWKEAEKNVQDLKNWEVADAKWKETEKEMNDAAADKAKADNERAKAVQADAAFKVPATTALNEAKTKANLNTVLDRMKIENKKILKTASDETLKHNTRAAEKKQKAQLELNKAQNEEQKKEIVERWKNYFNKSRWPLYVRYRNEAEMDRLRGIRDGAELQKYKCVQEVFDFISELNKKIEEVRDLRVSLASADFGNPLLSDEFIPPLDEKESGQVSIPNLIKESEGGYSADWKLEGGNTFKAKWTNGAEAVLTIERFDKDSVVIVRNDTGASVSQNFSARYTGTISGNSIVNGEVKFTQNGRTWYGRWSANW